MSNPYGVSEYDWNKERALKNSKIFKMMPKKKTPVVAQPLQKPIEFEKDPSGVLFPKGMNQTERQKILDAMQTARKLVR